MIIDNGAHKRVFVTILSSRTIIYSIFKLLLLLFCRSNVCSFEVRKWSKLWNCYAPSKKTATDRIEARTSGALLINSACKVSVSLYASKSDSESISESIPSESTSSQTTQCVIKVFGVGGGGCNAIYHMLHVGVHGALEFWAINTDVQALQRIGKKVGSRILPIGSSVTRGLGAGSDPEIGEMSALESRQQILDIVSGVDLCFITAGMGGGTGSGAAPIVAEIAKEAGCLTIAVVTKPFSFEGKRRMKQALDGIERLKKHVDTIIIVSNDRLLSTLPDDTPIQKAFAFADDLLRQGVVGISDLIVKPGLINVDFADVRSVMRPTTAFGKSDKIFMTNGRTALMGIGIGTGKTAAIDAARAAISSPLLDSTIINAKGIVFTISGGTKLTMNEINDSASLIYNSVAPDANVIFGAFIDESLGSSVSITVLATGYDETKGSECKHFNNTDRGFSKDPGSITERSPFPFVSELRTTHETAVVSGTNSTAFKEPGKKGNMSNNKFDCRLKLQQFFKEFLRRIDDLSM